MGYLTPHTAWLPTPHTTWLPLLITRAPAFEPPQLQPHARHHQHVRGACNAWKRSMVRVTGFTGRQLWQGGDRNADGVIGVTGHKSPRMASHTTDARPLQLSMMNPGRHASARHQLGIEMLPSDQLGIEMLPSDQLASSIEEPIQPLALHVDCARVVWAARRASGAIPALPQTVEVALPRPAVLVVRRGREQGPTRYNSDLKLASLTKGANRLRSPLHGLWHVKSFRVQEVRETYCLIGLLEGKDV
eukprot:CAMPEP_0181219982 /NCGR_PEP_ID=MMETSP1096-20121128/28587_1 /TAXON_ID=156174 ORGANISM="Chrysochromulina ericina, Strain CCMP281" /NCGR_SAMPLE_ID=MMETSP1096 /ASSEMBLY_ACC=CAM_ASM_000453 /LENGTH=245 /DNA_ID=CAMNT_0023312441 /DNA_START=247 /DNA_END=986 /DNA_ORIENTATION=+